MLIESLLQDHVRTVSSVFGAGRSIVQINGVYMSPSSFDPFRYVILKLLSNKQHIVSVRSSAGADCSSLRNRKQSIATTWSELAWIGKMPVDSFSKCLSAARCIDLSGGIE